MNSIKKLLIAAIATSCMLSFSSCSDDDSTPAIGPTPNQLISSKSLVGTWEMSGLTYRGRSTTTVGGNSTTAQFEGVGKDFTYVVQYNDNPKTYTTSGGYTVTLTSTINGSSFVQDAPVSNVISSGTWSLNGNELTSTDDNTMQSSTATILTSPNNNSFSVDFAGFRGSSLQGASVNITSGMVSYDRQ